jgi:hypothetical protein
MAYFLLRGYIAAVSLDNLKYTPARSECQTIFAYASPTIGLRSHMVHDVRLEHYTEVVQPALSGIRAG